MDPLLIDIKETCRTLSLGRTKVYELMNRGDLQTVKLGTRTLVRYESVKRLVGDAAPADEDSKE